MKSVDIGKVGTLAASTIMLGAALAGPVSAAMDPTGLTKGFFYDANMKPIVQIVVGENPKANPMDAVAAGNIAATIGNLAYVEKEVPAGGECGAEGQVVISSESLMSVGDYVQDDNADNLGCEGTEKIPDFWEKTKGLRFSGDKTYEKGDFTIYNVACAQQTREEAEILTEAEFTNVFCLFCQTLCKEGLEFDITHEMKEKIYINSSKIRYYEEGLNSYDSEALKMSIDEGAIKYTVETGFIPLETIKGGSDNATDIDYEYRGKIILFGEEYYVRQVKNPRSSNMKLYLTKGKVLEDLSSEGFKAEYSGYKFKIDHLIYSAEYVVAGIVLDVQKPDGTTTQVQVSKMANGQVDNLEIAGVTAQESASVATGSIIVYDKSTEVVLEQGKDLVWGGETKKYWRVSFRKGHCDDVSSDSASCDSEISEYDGTRGYVLAQIDIEYKHKLDGAEALEVGESLPFPNNFMLTFKGYLDSNAVESKCSGEGEGNIKVARGDEEYQLTLSFTGEDNNRYDNVRLDEGPFTSTDLFMLGGKVYKFVKADTVNDTRKKLTFDPVISGTRKRIDVDLLPENTPDLNVRFLALVDALDDTNPTENEKDENKTISADYIYVGGTLEGYTVYYDDASGTVMFPDVSGDNIYVQVNANKVGTFSKFQRDDNSLEFNIVQEPGQDPSLNYQDQADQTPCNVTYDYNCDGDVSDKLVKFRNQDGEVVYIDFWDRNYDEQLNGYTYDNNVFYDCDNDGKYNSTYDKKLDSDKDTVLILPKGGDTLTIDWGADNLIESVELCHPQSLVDATYFIGQEEQTSVVNSTITEADVGKDITAGCCTFHVADFNVKGTGEGKGTVKTKEITKIPLEDLGKFVVSESSADQTKNLILIGGPVVNSLTESLGGVTKEDIEAEPDKYIVKKVGNVVVVAGYEKEETVEAGNALIAWLQENIHA
ncbi:MAG: S-layer protein [Candidatus Altiarchaeota archaeon]